MDPNNDYQAEYQQTSPAASSWAPTRIQIVKETRIWPIVLASVITAVFTFAICISLLAGRNNNNNNNNNNNGSGSTIPGEMIVTPTQGQNEAQKEVWSDKLSQIKGYIDYYFIGDVDEAKLADAAAAGMIDGLGDEWSYYISKEEYDSYLESATNSYVGIGVTISIENVEKGIEIIDVSPDSPAYFAGLEIGDLIVAVEGVPVLDGSEDCLDMTETKNRVRGAEGTDVTITVSHDGVTRDVTITRAKIKTVNVTWEMLENDIAYIRIRNFELNAADDTIKAIELARASGANSLIFDVRYNPGGYKHELVNLLDYLLPEGPLFRSVDYKGRESVDTSDSRYLNMPMAVLVNYDSYSAAEFFAAALQEYKAAVIVGEQTYGKGRFQTVFDLDDGSAINISIGQYTTPNGISLVGKGITPDYVVEFTDEQKADLYYSRLEKEDDDQLQKAIEVLTAQ